MFRNAVILSLLLLIAMVVPATVSAAALLIPMDDTQTDHLKAYGIVFRMLEGGGQAQWLLNYRGGSFLVDRTAETIDRCLVIGVMAEEVTSGQVADIYRMIEVENMERVELEKAPAIAVYSPPTAQPWDDAVTLALNYAEIKYDIVYDEEVLSGDLEEYDWLHSHHEDYTGQYGKFYSAFRHEAWYQNDVRVNEALAHKMGYGKVSAMKRDVAIAIYDYVRRGGFLFAMCSAPETFDIALAAAGTDVVPAPLDGDPVDPAAMTKLDFSRTFAFENFTPCFDAMLYRHSDIDTYPDRLIRFSGPADDFFYLFDFAAKLDPVPSMLVQNHVGAVAGFMGQSTGMRKSLLKDFVTVLGQPDNFDEVRYIHGNLGRGTFTFLSGHDPEDYRHMVNDPPTELKLHKNSPGYRLILNNVLFPAAKRKDRKT